MFRFYIQYLISFSNVRVEGKNLSTLNIHCFAYEKNKIYLLFIYLFFHLKKNLAIKNHNYLLTSLSFCCSIV